MKTFLLFLSVVFVFVILNSCSKNSKKAVSIAIISDIHLGDSRALEQDYAWFNKNKNSLISFLDSLGKRKDIKTIVIAGDLFDEWVSPADVSAYPNYENYELPPDSAKRNYPVAYPNYSASHKDFILDIKEANKEVIEAIAALKKGGIDIFYVNGNHDMLVDAQDIEAVFGKGIVSYCGDSFNSQAALGTFYDKDLELIVEHGHRYDFFNAPYRQIFKDLNGNNAISILPPGFFAAKLSASASLAKEKGIKLEASKMEEIAKEFSALEKDGSKSRDTKLYAFAWNVTLNFLSIPQSRYKIRNIKTGIDYFEGLYSIEDFAPYLSNGALIDKRKIFKNIEKDWENTQKINGIDGIKQPFIPLAKAILADGITSYFDDMARSQYFDNTNSGVRIVVFGHSHEAKLITHYADTPSKKSIYANSGTWIDNSKISRNYVIVNPNKKAGKIFVSVYQIDENGKTEILGEDFIQSGL
jgi:UDP-2,3-diacylglucosamine pyrophosphatase LpxH